MTSGHVSVYDGTLPGGDQLRASTWKFKSNGRYEIIDLAPGDYTVAATCTSEDGTVLGQSKAVSIAEGKKARVDFVF